MPADTYPTPPPPARPGAPAAKRGAPLGNTNALKHGFYARAFQTAEQDDVSAIDPASLENEIQLLRVFMRRTAIQAQKIDNVNDSLMFLAVMSRAAISLASLMRTQRAAVTAHQHEELQLIFAQSRAEFARANALCARLEKQLAELEDARLRPVDPANPAFGYPTVALPTGALLAVADLPAVLSQPQPSSPPALPTPAAAPAADPSPSHAPVSPAAVVPPPPQSAPLLAPVQPDDDDDDDDDDDQDAAAFAGDLVARLAAGLTHDHADADDDDDDDPADLDPGECFPPLECIDCDNRPGCDLCPPNLLPFSYVPLASPPLTSP